MPQFTATVSSPLHDSFRVRQIAGMFDLPLDPQTSVRFDVELPGPEEDWSIGLIVGPSGSGKSTVAHHAFAGQFYEPTDWPADRAVIDCFGQRSIKEITQTLSSVGFSSPPAWLRPYAVLSNGEKFRCDLAKSLIIDSWVGTNEPSSSDPRPTTPDPRPTPLIVFDEFTSVVDRTVARIGSAAVSKAIRSGRIKRRFVAVSCHYDIAPWLEPDWVLDMATRKLARGRLRRPAIQLEIIRTDRSAWSVFKRHHYLSADLHPAAACYAALVDGSPAVLTAVLPFPHPITPGWREHRVVCLPDFQGLGLGNALSEFVASLYAATGKRYMSTTSHPAMIRHRAHSSLWRMSRPPSRVKRGASRAMAAMKKTSSCNRLTAGFTFAGAPRFDDAARFGLRVSRPSGSTIETTPAD
jgi:energy-coupling factor transporter ATP-binding protein EcfA2